jgi:hypothetical protein
MSRALSGVLCWVLAAGATVGHTRALGFDDLGGDVALGCSVYGSRKERDRQRSRLMVLANCSTPQCVLVVPPSPFLSDVNACHKGVCNTSVVQNLLVYDASRADDHTMQMLQTFFVGSCGSVNGDCKAGLSAQQLGCFHNPCTALVPPRKFDTWLLSAYITVVTTLFLSAANIDYLDINNYNLIPADPPAHSTQPRPASKPIF